MSEPVLGEPIAESESPLPEPTQTVLLPGHQLAVRRKEMGWSVEHVAAQLKLATRQIQALEVDDYASLPGMASVRGFIRAYAKLVKVEAGPLVAMITSEASSENKLAPTKRDLSAPFFDTRLPTKNRSGFPLKTFLLFLVVGVLALALSTQLQVIGPTWRAQLMKLVGVDSVAAVPVVRPVKLPEPAVPPVVAQEGNTPASTAVIALPAAVPSVAKLPADTLAEIPAESELVLQLRQDSWVEIKRADGTVQMKRLLRAGTHETFSVTGPFLLVIGNASGVDASLRGAALELKPAIGNVARLNLK